MTLLSHYQPFIIGSVYTGEEASNQRRGNMGRFRLLKLRVKSGGGGIDAGLLLYLIHLEGTVTDISGTVLGRMPVGAERPWGD